MDTKLIRVSQTTYSKLTQNGRYGETMDQIVQKLLSSSKTNGVSQ